MRLHQCSTIIPWWSIVWYTLMKPWQLSIKTMVEWNQLRSTVFSYHVTRSVCIDPCTASSEIITIYSVTTRYNNISQCLHFIYFLLFPFTVTAENTARVLPNIKSIFHRFRSITEARIRGVASLISMCVCNADLFLITFFNEILWTNPRGLKFNSMHRHQMLYINRGWTSTKKDAIGICL